LKTVALLAPGWALLVAGVAGLFLPILPGIPLLLAALIILSRHHAWARRLLAALRTRFARVAIKSEQVRQNARLWLLRRLDVSRTTNT
jgi:uncharacterized membrane protein YbaN (DUF454 family)